MTETKFASTPPEAEDNANNHVIPVGMDPAHALADKIIKCAVAASVAARQAQNILSGALAEEADTFSAEPEDASISNSALISAWELIANAGSLAREASIAARSAALATLRIPEAPEDQDETELSTSDRPERTDSANNETEPEAASDKSAALAAAFAERANQHVNKALAASRRAMTLAKSLRPPPEPRPPRPAATPQISVLDAAENEAADQLLQSGNMLLRQTGGIMTLAEAVKAECAPQDAPEPVDVPEDDPAISPEAVKTLTQANALALEALRDGLEAKRIALRVVAFTEAANKDPGAEAATDPAALVENAILLVREAQYAARHGMDLIKAAKSGELPAEPPEEKQLAADGPEQSGDLVAVKAELAPRRAETALARHRAEPLTAYARLKKNRRNLILFSFVYLPTLLIGVYFFFIHSPMYISESHFSLENNGTPDIASAFGGLLQMPTASSSDSHIIQQYVGSMDMLAKINVELDLYAHFSDRSHDPYSRLMQNPTREEMLDYWNWIASATYNADRGIISVEVKAYTPEMARKINEAILENSEELVNQMNNRAHQDSIRLSRAEVAGAEERLQNARAALQTFRDATTMLDPASTASGVAGTVMSMEAEITQLQAELTATLEVMQPGSPRVVELERRIAALNEQIRREKARLVDITDNRSLSATANDYARLAMEEQFAQDQLVKAMGALESARLQAIAQSRYIVPFQPPTLPEASLYPRPFLYTVYAFMALLVGVGLVSLILAAVKDHMEG